MQGNDEMDFLVISLNKTQLILVYDISSKDVMRTLSWTKLLLMEWPNKAIIPIGRFWAKFILMFNMNILPRGGGENNIYFQD
jgi:hypothetical protein